MTGMRFAFFGGSFDPPHLGHLAIAEAARDRLHLDQVLLAPVGRQPLKTHEPAPFADRLHMVSLLTSGQPGLVASSIDAPRLAPDARPGESPRLLRNYTVDTLLRLRPDLPAGAKLFFLAGADSFLTLHQWHRAEALVAPIEPPNTAQDRQGEEGLLTGWILAARPGFPLHSLAEALPAGYALGPQSEERGPVLTHTIYTPAGGPASVLHLLPDLEDPSTATEIREALATGRSAPHLLPRVSDYIRDHRLYTPDERMLG